MRPSRDALRSLVAAVALAMAVPAVAQAPRDAPIDPEVTRREPPPAPRGAAAQSAARPAANAPLKQVDAATADRNSLSSSLRVMPVELSPNGFDRVYQVPGRDDLLMRSNGALYAVFDQSVYSRDPRNKGALRVQVPAATVFYIGKPDFGTIRSTGIRDVDFVRSPAAGHASHAPDNLVSVPGVERFAAAPIDGRADADRPARVDGRFDAVPWCVRRLPDEDISYPARMPAREGPPAPDAVGTAACASSTEPIRQERPGFATRVDELIHRAKKAP